MVTSSIIRAGREEIGRYNPRLNLINALPRCVPTGTGGRLRSTLYRMFGIRIGRGTIIAGAITFASDRGFHERFQVGQRCFINGHVFIDVSAPVTVGDGVSIGHHVVIVTADHAVGPPEFRAGKLTAKPVTIDSGAWIAAGVTILPGVTVGHGAVVAAGAVVAGDVLPNTLVGGVPAKIIRHLTDC